MNKFIKILTVLILVLFFNSAFGQVPPPLTITGWGDRNGEFTANYSGGTGAVNATEGGTVNTDINVQFASDWCGGDACTDGQLDAIQSGGQQLSADGNVIGNQANVQTSVENFGNSIANLGLILNNQTIDLNTSTDSSVFAGGMFNAGLGSSTATMEAGSNITPEIGYSGQLCPDQFNCGDGFLQGGGTAFQRAESTTTTVGDVSGQTYTTQGAAEGQMDVSLAITRTTDGVQGLSPSMNISVSGDRTGIMNTSFSNGLGQVTSTEGGGIDISTGVTLDDNWCLTADCIGGTAEAYLTGSQAMSAIGTVEGVTPGVWTSIQNAGNGSSNLSVGLNGNTMNLESAVGVNGYSAGIILGGQGTTTVTQDAGSTISPTVSFSSNMCSGMDCSTGAITDGGRAWENFTSSTTATSNSANVPLVVGSESSSNITFTSRRTFIPAP